MNERKRLSARDICLMALLTALLFVQEELLTFLPNIQLTVFLILLYTETLGLWRTGIIVTVYLLLDAAFMGALNPLTVVFQWIGWMLGPVLASLFLRKTEEPLRPALFAAGHALLYSWVMIVPGVILTQVPVRAYLAADLLFELLLAASSFLSTLLLWQPLCRLLRKMMPENG